MTRDYFAAVSTRAARAVARFSKDQAGAITVDWVVLTGFIVFLGIATSFYVATSVPMVAEKTQGTMENMTVMPD
ncbi:MAG: hypothetical protein KDK10_00015 [Maritimibacter sp.]|nr:hypothetical protein [Maritimibacter sp.]